MCMSHVGVGRMHLFRYIGLVKVLGVQNLHFDSRLFSFFFWREVGGSENLGMKVFVDIFGVTSKIEFFMFFSSKINNWYLIFMM